MRVDFRALLKKYMIYVEGFEGTNFLGPARIDCGPFTADERKALLALDQEIAEALTFDEPPAPGVRMDEAGTRVLAFPAARSPEPEKSAETAVRSPEKPPEAGFTAKRENRVSD